jgi:hypothetical protein
MKEICDVNENDLDRVNKNTQTYGQESIHTDLLSKTGKYIID